MLVLKTLKFKNIGRFSEEQTISFSKLGSLTQVEGQNNNTNGSSGAGKSTIFKALEYLLGLNSISSGILQSRLTKDPILVEGEFDYDGKPLIIERSKKLSITLDGQTTIGSSKITEELLDSILGMERDLFRKIIHKRQGETGFFLNFSPSETHKFLTSCLGLQSEQAKIATLDSILSDLKDKELSLSSALESHKMGYTATNDAISSLGLSPTLEVTPEGIEVLKTVYLQAIEDRKSIISVQKNEIEELEKSRISSVSPPFDRSKIEFVESQIGTIIAQIQDLEKKELDRQILIKSKLSELQILSSKLMNSELTRQKDVQSKANNIGMDILKILHISDQGKEAKKQASQLMKELKKIKELTCPTCDQKWENEFAKVKEESLLKEIKSRKELVIAGLDADNKALELEELRKNLILESNPKTNEELTSLLEQMRSLQEESKPQAIPEAIELKLTLEFQRSILAVFVQDEKEYHTKNYSEKVKELNIFTEKLNNLKDLHEISLLEAQDKERLTYIEYETSKNKLSSFQEAKKRFDESHKKLANQFVTYMAKIVSTNEKLFSIQKEIELAEESKKVIKSYLSCSFEDALSSISDEATRIIRNIPNMATSTILLEGLKENKDGKIKEEVNATISMDGETNIPIKSLSGGERSSADLSVDLAVIHFIEERTGKGMNVLILDEFTNGLDTVCIGDAIEMLKNSNLDKKLLIVEHNQIASQAIENKIVVIRDGLTSRVVQQ